MLWVTWAWSGSHAHFTGAHALLSFTTSSGGSLTYVPCLALYGIMTLCQRDSSWGLPSRALPNASEGEFLFSIFNVTLKNITETTVATITRIQGWGVVPLVRC